MPTEAGSKMQECIKAVCRMHASVSTLLTDFDKYVAWPSTSVFGNTATKDLTYATKAESWMPEGVFRYLSSKSNPRLVEAITICFVEPALEEPVLLIGQLEYTDDPLQMRTMCDGWDLWHLYFPIRTVWSHRVAVSCTVPATLASRIHRATLVSAPLYSISRISDVRVFLETVRGIPTPAGISGPELVSRPSGATNQETK
jgi:hypothetical protein